MVLAVSVRVGDEKLAVCVADDFEEVSVAIPVV